MRDTFLENIKEASFSPLYKEAMIFPGESTAKALPRLIRGKINEIGKTKPFSVRMLQRDKELSGGTAKGFSKVIRSNMKNPLDVLEANGRPSRTGVRRMADHYKGHPDAATRWPSTHNSNRGKILRENNIL